MKDERDSQSPILPAYPSPEFTRLYPDFTPEEAAAAEERFEQYIALAVRIYQRISQDPAAYAAFRRLTAARKHGRKRERSNT